MCPEWDSTSTFKTGACHLLRNQWAHPSPLVRGVDSGTQGKEVPNELVAGTQRYSGYFTTMWNLKKKLTWRRSELRSRETGSWGGCLSLKNFIMLESWLFSEFCSYMENGFCFFKKIWICLRPLDVRKKKSRFTCTFQSLFCFHNSPDLSADVFPYVERLNMSINGKVIISFPAPQWGDYILADIRNGLY